MGLFTAHEIDPAEIADKHGALLLPGEEVLTAFRTVRDTAFLTTLRFVLVDVQGLTGSKTSVMSVPYRAITRFAVTSAGTLDLDSELQLWVSGQSSPISTQVSRHADSAAIQRLLAERVLGSH